MVEDIDNTSQKAARLMELIGVNVLEGDRYTATLQNCVDGKKRIAITFKEVGIETSRKGNK
jgi:hypothetical protein